MAVISSDAIQNIASAIAYMEGFTNGTSRPAVENNNPGNIRAWLGGGRDQMRYGFVVFPSVDDGWRALRKVVTDYVQGRYTGGRPPTLQEMFARYAPSSDNNDPNHYAAVVSQRTGIPLSVPILTHLTGQPVSSPLMTTPSPFRPGPISTVEIPGAAYGLLVDATDTSTGTASTDYEVPGDSTYVESLLVPIAVVGVLIVFAFTRR